MTLSPYLHGRTGRRVFGGRKRCQLRRKAGRSSLRIVPRLDTLEGRSLPSTFAVTSLGDNGAGTLRQAILSANATPGADAIAFDSTFFTTPRTIALTSGPLTITDSLTITGPGANRLTVSGNNASRIFDIDGPGALTVNLSGLTLSGGRTTSGGGAIAIQDENVTISDSVITGNTATGSNGGAIAEFSPYPSISTLTILRSTISGNFAGGAGGAVAAGNRALVIRDSALSGNSAGAWSGGAIEFNTYDFGSTLSVQNCTFSGNTAVTEGGAINFYAGLNGSLLVQNSTISGNRAGNNGGGIAFHTYLSGALLLQNSTITANTVTGTATGQGGGGIAMPFSRGVTVVSSIVSGNVNANAPDILSPGTAPVDVNFSAIGSAIGFVLSATSGNNLPFGANLNLGPLADNGGANKTHALLPGSPAIDAGGPAAPGTYDQRGPGFARVVCGRVDIGAYEAPAGAPYTFTVTSLADSGPGSLRQSILDANSPAYPYADTITLALTGTINLASALPDLSTNINIQGRGAGLLTVRRGTGGDYRIFTVANSATVSLVGLTISNGDMPGFPQRGGGISNGGTLTLNNVTVSGNSAGDGGGGIYNTGTLVLNHTAVTGNDVGDFGGGIWNSGTLTLNESTVSGNYSALGGGGVVNDGTLTLNNSTVNNNHAWWYGSGGGIRNAGTATISGCTVSGNYADGDGGGIFNAGGGSLTLVNSTVSGNAAYRNGGGVSNSGGGTAMVRNTIVAANTAVAGNWPDFAGAIFSLGYNLIGIGDGANGPRAAGDKVGTIQTPIDPRLGQLADNGGPTKTHALLPGSPAINAGDPAATGDYDQRGPGFARVVGGRIDIGAYEVQTVPGPWVTDTQVNGGAAQRSRVTDITAIFNQVVTFAGSATAAFRVTRIGPGGPTGDVTLAVDLSGSTATRTVARLSFSGGLTEFGSLIDGNYSLTVVSSQVSAGGVPLDGNLDGTPGGDLTMPLFRIYGDVNGDKAVNGLDLAVFRSAFGTVSSDPNYVPALDFDGDGAINSTDLTQFRNRFGVILP